MSGPTPHRALAVLTREVDADHLRLLGSCARFAVTTNGLFQLGNFPSYFEATFYGRDRLVIDPEIRRHLSVADLRAIPDLGLDKRPLRGLIHVPAGYLRQEYLNDEYRTDRHCYVEDLTRRRPIRCTVTSQPSNRDPHVEGCAPGGLSGEDRWAPHVITLRVSTARQLVSLRTPGPTPLGTGTDEAE